MEQKVFDEKVNVLFEKFKSQFNKEFKNSLESEMQKEKYLWLNLFQLTIGTVFSHSWN
jgi:hypothetical protein